MSVKIVLIAWVTHIHLFCKSHPAYPCIVHSHTWWWVEQVLHVIALTVHLHILTQSLITSQFTPKVGHFYYNDSQQIVNVLVMTASMVTRPCLILHKVKAGFCGKAIAVPPPSINNDCSLIQWKRKWQILWTVYVYTNVCVDKSKLLGIFLC